MLGLHLRTLHGEKQLARDLLFAKANIMKFYESRSNGTIFNANEWH